MSCAAVQAVPLSQGRTPEGWPTHGKAKLDGLGWGSRLDHQASPADPKYPMGPSIHMVTSPSGSTPNQR